MEKLIGYLSFVKEQSIYFNMSITIISFVILFLPIVAHFVGNDTLDDLLKLRDDFLPYVVLVFLFSFIVSLTQILSKRASKKKRKRILKSLEELRSVKQLEKGFKSQQDCLNWANKVAPLLKQISMQNYVNFAPFAQKLNVDGISGTIAKSFLNTMVSNLDQAINELKESTYRDREEPHSSALPHHLT
ncbi:MAG: hypothetical protein KAU41_09770 [Deltaproteobacteria bacterium]|nr:hypothetical protein [Deltaproteobacteria bacterium]